MHANHALTRPISSCYPTFRQVRLIKLLFGPRIKSSFELLSISYQSFPLFYSEPTTNHNERFIRVSIEITLLHSRVLHSCYLSAILSNCHSNLSKDFTYSTTTADDTQLDVCFLNWSPMMLINGWRNQGFSFYSSTFSIWGRSLLLLAVGFFGLYGERFLSFTLQCTMLVSANFSFQSICSSFKL